MFCLDWVEELRQNVPLGEIVLAMVATKCDLATNPDTSHAEALAASVGAMFMTTSAKTNSNVNLLFRRVSERVLQNQQRLSGLETNLPMTMEPTGAELNDSTSSTNSTSSNRQHPQSIGAYGGTGGISGNGDCQAQLYAVNGSRTSAAPLTTIQEREGPNVVRTAQREGRQQIPEGDDNEVVDLVASHDSSKDNMNMPRCDSMLLCGNGAPDNGPGCLIQ